MTTLAILADIHGNLPALEAVAGDLAQFAVDGVIVAGDVIGWGPFSAQVLERITGEGWPAIRGNHELYLLDYQTARAPAAWDDRARFSLLPWLHRQLRGRWRNTIAAWPDGLSLRFPDAPPVRVVHGSPRSHWEPLFPLSPEAEIETMLAGVEEGTVVAAHTHLAMDRTAGRWHLLNPGTVGVPLDGLFSASYLLLEGDATGWRPTFRRVPFDYEPLFREFARQGFVEECGVIGQLVLEEFRTARIQVAAFNRWHRACCPDQPLTMDLLAAFATVDKWDYILPAHHLNLDVEGDL